MLRLFETGKREEERFIEDCDAVALKSMTAILRPGGSLASATLEGISQARLTERRLELSKRQRLGICSNSRPTTASASNC